MYLNRLEDDEKLAFYSLANAVASAQDGISTAESKLLSAAVNEMQIEPPAQLLTIDEAIEKLSTDESRKIALLELMLMAMVDDDFSDAERHVIEQALNAFNFSENHVERAASWAESMLALFKTGQRFIERA